MNNLTIQHDTEEQRFFAELDGKEVDAEMTYSLPQDKVINFNHTYVENELRNMKIAEKLATTALEYARENGYTVVATCQYVSSFIKRHPEYQDLL